MSNYLTKQRGKFSREASFARLWGISQKVWILLSGQTFQRVVRCMMIVELGIKCSSILKQWREIETDGEENVGLFHLKTMDGLILHYSP